MGVDEPGDDDVTGRADDPSVAGGKVGADAGDRVALDENVRVRQLTELGDPA